MNQTAADDRTPPAPGATRQQHAAVAAVFFVSGVSALIYQVAWQRILALQSGVGLYSVAVIVAAFMAGLGIGSYAGGTASRGMAARRALQIFAVLELGIGSCALVSTWFLYDLLFVEFGWLFALPWRAGLVQFASLLVPTTLMGMSLPFLAQAVVGHTATAARTIGFFYGLNTLGAALGALLTPWVLIRFLGIPGAISVGAAGNLLAGATVLAVAFRASPAGRTPRSQPEGAAVSTPVPAGSRSPFSLWIALYALSGFCALSLEIVWFRVLDVAVKSTAFTFGTVLAIFLLGIGAGSAVGGSWALRLNHPLRAFLLCQSSLLTLSAFSLALIARLPVGLPGYSALVDYWARYGEFPLGRSWDAAHVLGLYLALPLFLYGAPTFLMGLSFGILQRAVHDDRSDTGFKVGVLQAANIAGNVAGSLVTGLVLLTWLGTTGSVRLLLGIGAGFAVFGLWSTRPRAPFALALTALTVAWLALPDNAGFWRRLHGLQQANGMIEEDATGVAAIIPQDSRLVLFVNGKGHSWIPFGQVHTLLGAAPAALHPAPRRVAIIGLGSGDTAWAASFREETERVDVFELIAPELRLLEELGARERVPALDRFLADSRVTVRNTDGRAALSLEDQRYDVIEADALRPHSAYSGNLYSLEFFRLCSKRLAAGGLVASWAPTPRIRRTFFEAFPHVVEIPGEDVLIGSLDPIAIDPEQWSARVGSPSGIAHFGRRRARQLEEGLRSIEPARRAGLDSVLVNRDLFPRDEFHAPQRGAE